jgi:hypothetical protein
MSPAISVISIVIISKVVINKVIISIVVVSLQDKHPLIFFYVLNATTYLKLKIYNSIIYINLYCVFYHSSNSSTIIVVAPRHLPKRRTADRHSVVHSLLCSVSRFTDCSFECHPVKCRGTSFG